MEIKFEPFEAERPLFENEARVHSAAAGIVGIPSIHWFGEAGRNRVLITDLLGPSIEDHLEICRRRLSVKTVLLLADQAFSLLQDLHERSFIHGDVAPYNLLMGVGKIGA